MDREDYGEFVDVDRDADAGGDKNGTDVDVDEEKLFGTAAEDGLA